MHPPVRVSVVGNSGSGKSTTARRLSAVLGVPWLELDSLRHQAGWRELPDDEFRARVVQFIEQHDEWIIEGNYRTIVQTAVWAGATQVVWIDLPKPVNMAQIVWRTLRRTITRERLWNGNRERTSNLWSIDPKRSIIAWAWTRHALTRQMYALAQVDPRWFHLRFARLCSHAEVDAWIERLRTEAATEDRRAR